LFPAETEIYNEIIGKFSYTTIYLFLTTLGVLLYFLGTFEKRIKIFFFFKKPQKNIIIPQGIKK